MKVLMFGWEFPPFNSGGLGVACRGLTRALTHTGTNITFVLPKKLQVDADDMRVVYADGVTIKQIDSILTPYITSEGYLSERSINPTGLYANSLIEEVLRYGALAGDIATREDHNIIHAHDWLSFPAGIQAHKRSGRPFVAHVHATEFDRSGGQGVNQAVYDIEREGMHRAQSVIAVSNFTKRIIVDKYGVNPNKVHVVYNGIDLNDHSHALNAHNLLALKDYGIQIVLFAGRITLQKGPDYFLQTAKKVLEYMPKTLFLMTGSGDMERKMVNLSAHLGIADRVSFTGYLRGKDLNTIYKSADLMVMPSVSEPFGITALESIANGTPVLVSKQSGVSEVVSHALTADFWDVDEMANMIISVLKHQSLQHTLRENGHAQVKHITWTKAAQKCEEIYRSLNN